MEVASKCPRCGWWVRGLVRWQYGWQLHCWICEAWVRWERRP